MRYLKLISLSVLLCCMSAANAVSSYISNPLPVGEARLEVMFFDIYDAKLIASDGDFHPDKPFALSLTYLREFKGKSIASRSIDEMRDQGMEDEVKLATWFEQMQQLFPDVDKGQTITGIADASGRAVFYYNDSKIGSVDDPDFTQWFFNIWLSENTSQPKMREKLLGLNND